MSKIPHTENALSSLPVYAERRFVPVQADLGHVQEVAALYEKLLHRELQSRKDLEQWLLDRSELEAAVDQYGTVLYIRMTCQTDDKEKAERYKNFIETIPPVIKPLTDQLNHKFLRESARFPLDSQKYDVYLRTLQSDVDLFVQDNVPLQTKVSLLAQEYQTLTGAMTVHFQGEERTLPEMSKFLLEPDRELRESAWRATAERRLKDQSRLDHLFDQMLALRHSIAENAGCSNYCDYQFRAYHRFDYTPQHCKLYHDTVERLVVPVWKEVLKKRKTEMKLTELRPWDLGVDPQGRPPLKPFEKVEDLISGTGTMFDRVDPQLGSQFKMMIDLGLLDLASRKGKAPGGYQSTLSEVRKPFIFMNAVGVDDDVNTLLHEGGHAFHALATADQPLLDYRHGPMEFNEVASMGMELLGREYLDIFYSEEDRRRSRQEHLEGIVHILGWVATIDSFQQWIYEHPKHSQQERRQKWVEIYRRFDGQVVNWTGLEEPLGSLWHRQLHIFEVPFYYIEYGIAQLGALQLWLNTKKNRPAALTAYKQGLSLGGSRPLPEIYKTAGLVFDFSEKTIAPLMDAVMKELNDRSSA